MKPNANRLNISESELIAEINKMAKVIPLRPVGFGVTCSEYCDAQKPPVAFSTGRRVLGMLVADGKLKAQHMKQRGHLVTVYYK